MRDATWSTMARRCASRSLTSGFTYCRSTNERDRAMVARRFRISLASSAGPSAPASSRRSRRLAMALPSLISISSAANRAAPRASRLSAFRLFLDAMPPSLFRIPGRACRLIDRNRGNGPGNRTAIAVTAHQRHAVYCCRACGRYSACFRETLFLPLPLVVSQWKKRPASITMV